MKLMLGISTIVLSSAGLYAIPTVRQQTPAITGRVSASPYMTIGDPAKSEEAFDKIGSANIVGDVVVVADRGSNTVRLFDLAGKRIALLGGKGGGTKGISGATMGRTAGLPPGNCS